jgi:hypothetical protein
MTGFIPETMYRAGTGAFWRRRSIAPLVSRVMISLQKTQPGQIKLYRMKFFCKKNK